MPLLGSKPPDPPNQGIQSYVLFGDLDIRRSEILWSPQQAKLKKQKKLAAGSTPVRRRRRRFCRRSFVLSSRRKKNKNMIEFAEDVKMFSVQKINFNAAFEL